MTRNHLVQMAHAYMEYDMIELHTELPEFPEGRIRLLHAVLASQPASAGLRDMLSVVASLVQMGLDTHDLVDNGRAAERGGLLAMRARQLKVLAGDYFSGRFYYLLSQAGQIEMVRRLGDAICELNRVKVVLYSKMKQMKLNAEEYLLHGAELRSGLFKSFTHLMTGLYERTWPDVVDRFARCEVLLQELLRIEAPSRLNESWGVWHILQEGAEEDRLAVQELQGDPKKLRQLLDKYGVAEKLSALLRQAVAGLQAQLQKLPSDKLIKDVQPLMEPFLQALRPVPAAMTELG
ncbi:heptaprenyl diphosphate synthase component 1 [Cohnella lubricantis]|uniref:Heptaprenyl diphosphate synthase component 1 n=1 Tax=Cohnella lubricantis TaxID=2163172 RepID=A0A841TCK8_9BACL|nr:heptaprenyl diphosphate synthase component 1 [Cohnella lubricantis]MBB6677745.1 heptaprenyl diphosphate synthase component 1 [Cohnella lubricantis]MBP2117707.1 heptaprenyl diphosphate synthase [Cohnella lubricantis]